MGASRTAASKSCCSTDFAGRRDRSRRRPRRLPDGRDPDSVRRSAAIPVVVLVIFLFLIGEMLWVPTSQSVVAGLAPADVRGAYMGAFGSGAGVGFAFASDLRSLHA